MSDSSDQGESVDVSDALDDLRTYLDALYPKAVASGILEAVTERTHELAKGNPRVAIGAIEDFKGELAELHRKGVVGIAYSELIPADILYHAETIRHRLLLRFFKHYLEPPEYKALLTSFHLRRILSNPGRREDPPGMVDGLYRKLNSLRKGRQVYNQVSSGNLEEIIYPEMRRVESTLVQAGRVRDKAPKEKVKQILYHALEPRRDQFWANHLLTPSDIFDEVYKRLIEARGDHLTIYGAREAWVHVQAVAERFIELYYTDFEMKVEEDEANPLVGKVVISRRKLR